MVDLSPRQAQIAQLVAQGLSNREISQQLGLRDGTVKAHKQMLYRKLGVRNAVEMARALAQ